MSDPNEELPVAEFFDNKDAIGLIARIDRENGNITKELVDKVKLTDKPVGSLLEDAMKYDLIEETIQSGDHGRANRYQLTKRGKSVQSLLRGIGLDETHREYLDSKRELEDSVPDVQAIIEETGLNKKYVQQDYWIRSDFDTEEIEHEQLLQDLEQEEQALTETEHMEARELDKPPVEILDEEDGDDLGRSETWGTSEEEDSEGG